MEPTDQLVEMAAGLCRVWYGVTDEGLSCVVVVRHVAPAEGTDAEALARSLERGLPLGHVVDLAAMPMAKESER